MTLLNYWHFITFGVFFLMFIAGVVVALKQEDIKIKIGMIITSTVVTVLLA